MSMALEHKDFRQRNCEASTCIENKGPNNLQYNEKKVDGYPELKDNISYHTGGNVAGKVHPWGRDILEPPNECPWGRDIAYPCDFGSWSTFHLNARKVQQCQMNAFTGQYYPFPMENHFQHVPFSMSAQNFPHEFQFQDFRYFVVIDFEATCDKDKNPHPQEIIEFPSVIVSSLTGQLEACFQTYVRPTLNQHLSDFCKDLTGIQQIQVDRGITLSEALLRHDKWLEKKGIKNTNFAVVTWSNWDCRVMLESECRFKKIWKPPYFNRWINLKVPFSEVFGGMRCNLKEAVEMAGLTWQGRAHCGLDDAKNTARLLTLIMGRGFKFSFTNSLMWKTSDNLLISISSSPHSSHELKDMQTPIFQSDSYCYCGVKSSRGMVRKPGPKQGSCFFGCGNWTASRGAVCHYFEWASP